MSDRQDMMRALVWRGPYQLAIEETPKPVPRAGELLIKTKAVGICGSDLEIYDGRFKQAVGPLIIGHEGGGIVEQVGAGVNELKPGDRVIVECLLYCGKCLNCRCGLYNLCTENKVIGMIGYDGEYADYFVAPAKNAHVVPDEISWEEAGMIDTLAGPLAAMNRATLNLDDSVVVYGGGPAGLFFCRLAKLRGAGKVYLVEPREARLAFGQQYGADVVLNPKKDPVKDIIMAATEGYGADLVIEASGAAQALNSGLEVVKRGGELFVFGVFGGGPIGVDIQPIQLKEVSVLGVNGAAHVYPATMKLIREGTVNVEALVSHTFGMDDLPGLFSSGFILEARDNYMKGVILF